MVFPVPSIVTVLVPGSWVMVPVPCTSSQGPAQVIVAELRLKKWEPLLLVISTPDVPKSTTELPRWKVVVSVLAYPKTIPLAVISKFWLFHING